MAVDATTRILTKNPSIREREPAILAPRHRHCRGDRSHNKSRINRFDFEVRRAPNMATAIASSSSVFFERCDALRGSAVKNQQRPHGAAVVRCDGSRRSDHGVVSRRLAACAVVAMGALVQLPVRALLEADEDESLLEKVKEDKKKRIQKRSTAINEFVKESEYVQVAVYKLSEAGQAIDGGDYSKATAVLAQQNADWIRDIQAALNKVSSNSDEKAAADNFRTALSSLQAAVKSGDSISSRTAFIASAEALDRWTRLTGLSEKVVGL